MAYQSLEFFPEKCTGCNQCELTCSGINDGIFQVERSRIRIFKYNDSSFNVPHACHQCDEAWCMHACPVQAITMDSETGVKVLASDDCVGCKVCTIACPYGKVKFQPESGKAVKCDLCGGDPACIEACPTSAIGLRTFEPGASAR